MAPQSVSNDFPVRAMRFALHPDGDGALYGLKTHRLTVEYRQTPQGKLTHTMSAVVTPPVHGALNTTACQVLKRVVVQHIR